MPRPVLVPILLLCAASPLLAENGEAEAPPTYEELAQRVEALEKSGLEREIENLLADDEGPGLGIVLRRGDVEVTVQIFGDVGFSYRNPERGDRGNTSYFVGGTNLFATARVGDHLQILNETVIKTSERATGDDLVFSQERLWASWTFSDGVYVKLGLEHGPISRWNRIYHHGRYLETSIERPMLARFETDDGILPMHNAALEVGGQRITGAGRLEYLVLVANGRGETATETQKVSDRNDEKAVVASVGFFPRGLQGVRVGATFRVDDVPATFGDLDEWALAFSVEHRGERIDVIAEFVHFEQRNGTTWSNQAGYVQVAYHFDDRWTLYTRGDVREMEQGNPFYFDLGRDLDRWEHLVGVRYELTSNAAAKFELGYGREERRGAAGVRTEWYFRGGFQISWVF